MGDVYEAKFWQLEDEFEGYRKTANECIGNLRDEVKRLKQRESELMQLLEKLGYWDEPVVKLYTPYPGSVVEVTHVVLQHLLDHTKPCC